MRKMMRIAAGLAALALVAVMAGCKGKEKSNVAVEIAEGPWVCRVPHEVPEGLDYHGTILYSYEEYINYEFGIGGSYFYHSETGLSPATYRDGTYSVNAKQGKIVLTESSGYDYTLEIKGDTLVDKQGRVFTKE